MAASGHFDGTTIKQLRQYLRSENQKISGTKDELIKRAIGVQILQKGDHFSSNRQSEIHQKLVTPCGKVLPEPLTLTTEWNDDWTYLPEFTENEIFNYMVLSNHRSSDARPMMAKRQLKAEIFYKDRHVHSISLHNVDEDSDHMFVRALVIPSLPITDVKNNPDHKVWICLSKVTGRVHSANCTCAAGTGEACNHIAALMYGLVDISDKKREGLLACTSTECKWNRPRKRKMSPERSFDLNLMSSGRKSMKKDFVCVNPEEKDPKLSCPNSNMPVSRVNTDRFCKNISKSENLQKCGFFVNSFPPSNDELPKLPEIEYCLADHVDITEKVYEEKFSDYFGSIKISADEVSLIERKTRGQHKSDHWSEIRHDRITTSNFGRVYKRKPTTKPDKLVHSLCGYSGNFSNVHTRWGISHEPAARRQYVSQMSITHPMIKVTQCGLILNPHYPFLATSPDGLVTCEQCSICLNHEEGLVEIKCPSVNRNLSPQDAATQDTFFCSLINNQLRLKTTHLFYYQIQGQMAITGRTWCDFVVWTLKGISIERIYFDETLWSEMSRKLHSFYLSYVIPEKFTQRVKCGVPLL